MSALASPFAPFTGVGGGDPFGGLTAFGFTIPQGNPAEIEAGARSCLDRSVALTTQAGSIEQGARIALGDWHGEAQAAFAAYAGHASSALHTNADALTNASAALDRLAVELQRAQDITQRAAAECATCQQQLTTAEQDANQYTQDAQSLSRQAALAPSPHTQAALNHQATVAADQAHAAQTDANRARDQLDLAQQQGRNADQAYQEQADQIRGQIAAAQADIHTIPRLPAGAPIPITITSADISLATRLLRGAGNLAAAAQAAAHPAKLRRLAGGHLTPAAAAAYLRVLHIAPRPQSGSLLDAAGGFVNAVTLGAISFGNPNTARYRGGETAAMIPLDPESLIVDGDRIAATALEDSAKAAKGVGGAANAADAARLAGQLTEQEAASVFTSSGQLHADVISGSHEIIPGSQLGNASVIRELTSNGSRIQDWGKYATQGFRRPGGSFQVHFYYNRVTGDVNYGVDYKVKFTGPGGR